MKGLAEIKGVTEDETQRKREKEAAFRRLLDEQRKADQARKEREVAEKKRLDERDAAELLKAERRYHEETVRKVADEKERAVPRPESASYTSRHVGVCRALAADAFRKFQRRRDDDLRLVSNTRSSTQVNEESRRTANADALKKAQGPAKTSFAPDVASPRPDVSGEDGFRGRSLPRTRGAPKEGVESPRRTLAIDAPLDDDDDDEPFLEKDKLARTLKGDSLEESGDADAFRGAGLPRTRGAKRHKDDDRTEALESM